VSTDTFARSSIGKLSMRVLASAMESRFRYRFFNPASTLQGVFKLHGQTVLEVGCGTGFFTLPAARLIGDQGLLTAMDVLSESVELVSKKVQEASLKNVRVVQGDALNTNLDSESIQTVLLFGVIPAPMLPLTRLLREMHRVLTREGILAVWPPVPLWLPHSILQSGLFACINKQRGVYNFRRMQARGVR
jgi:ubiquinone/menaquinone biosynthesis C-methylase UbiE